MDLSVAATMFDDQPIYDKYTGDLLFMGQPLPYDGSVRDSVASWRQSVSSAQIVIPPRGVVTFGDETFVAGRVVQDFFRGSVIRENIILHPCDDSYYKGAAADFLDPASPGSIVPFYGGATWRKSIKDEKESPELQNVCDIYFSVTEDHPEPDGVILSASGILYRVMAVEHREGGFIVAVCSELGEDAIVDASYVGKGAYDASTDSIAENAPISLKAVVELVKTNFKFVVADAPKYKPGDRVISVRVADVTVAKPEDEIVVSGVSYRVISVNLDEAGSCWELHVRRS